MGRVHVAIVSLLFLLTSVVLANGGAAESLHAALERQDSWLSASDSGPAWQQYLRTAELREALAAPAADRRLLASILARYNSKAPGLDAGPFVATRDALSEYADEVKVPMALRWSEQLRASTMFTPGFSDIDVNRAKLQVIDAKNALDAYLSSSEPAVRDGWKVFLKWDDLETHLRQYPPDWKLLDGVIRQFFNGYPGLEFPRFVHLRESLKMYSYIGKLADSDEASKNVNLYLTALSEALSNYNFETTTKHASDAASLADWLEALQRDQHIADQLRQAHSQPNVLIRVSEELLSRRFSQSVNDSSPVNEMILKTHVRGTAVTTGTITTDVVANPHSAQINILFEGVSTTESRGRQKPVTICSTSVANLQACKPLYLYPTDVTSAPAHATGKVETTIHSIVPDKRMGSKLIENVAWKRAKQQKPKSEKIAAERAAKRLEAKIDEQAAELLTRARDSLREQIQGPINRRGLIPESIRTSSTDTHAIVTAVQAGKGQLAVTNVAPAIDWANDVVAQVHESAINNTMEKAIAGLTLTDERIAELVEKLTGQVPEELQITEDDQPWSISFDWKQPVTVEFDNQQLKMSVRGRRFTRGETVLDRVMEMSGTYDMQVVPDKGVVLTRQGEVEVQFPGREGRQLQPSELVFKTLMEEKFSQLFKPVIEGEGFTLPGRFSELGTIRLERLSTDAGWLSLGWK